MNPSGEGMGAIQKFDRVVNFELNKSCQGKKINTEGGEGREKEHSCAQENKQKNDKKAV